MKYPNITEGRFVSRPNRFIATVTVDGIDQTVHVKNTGRCRELLLPQCKVWLTMPDSHGRKTKYDLVAVEKQRDEKMPLIINMDSQIPNGVVYEWLPKSGLFSSNAVIRREVTHGNSRFDVYVEDGERKAFIEVKGVTLEDKGIAMFPDAPTERGIKHLTELTECVREGYESYVVFVIQMSDIQEFRPNDKTHKAFGDALRHAAKNGVNVVAMKCDVTPDSIEITTPVNVQL